MGSCFNEHEVGNDLKLNTLPLFYFPTMGFCNAAFPHTLQFDHIGLTQYASWNCSTNSTVKDESKFCPNPHGFTT